MSTATVRRPRRRRAGRHRRAQHGLTLIELLIALAIGLMVVAVALGALLVSRGVSGTVSEASQIQQQGAYALRVIGHQLRQAGSVRLNLAIARPADTASAPQTFHALDEVAFENVFDRSQGGLASSTQYPLQVAYQNYTEQVVAGGAAQSLLRDCRGRAPSDTEILSAFRLHKAEGALSGDLQCAGSGESAAQPLIGNVADFQVRYLLQGGAAGAQAIRRVDAAGVGADWPAVVAVEVCLELVGDERIDTASATYLNCEQVSNAMGDRMRLVFRNTFQLRAQGGPR